MTMLDNIPDARANVRVLVVDDSAFMRKALSKMLSIHPNLEVTATARNGAEALDVIRQKDPDIVTLDVEMPVMDGLSTLKVIMREMPRPVLMVSSITTEGAQVTLEALSLGAVDFIPKQCSFVSLAITKIEQELCEKVYRLGRRRQRVRLGARPIISSTVQPSPRRLGSHQAVVIGSSTGGPSALEKLLAQIPRDFPLPILIVQHMPRLFTQSLAERMDRVCALPVCLAQPDMPVQGGHIYIAPGEEHLTVERVGTRVLCRLAAGPVNKPHCPSVDVLFSSAARVYGRSGLGIILTGMGNDGQAGAIDMVAQGGMILAQNEESCVVYGMPKAVTDTGLAKLSCDLDCLAGHLKQYCPKLSGVTK